MNYYEALANIGMGSLEISKGQPVTKELYDSLPDGLKIKFKLVAGRQEPLGRNQIVGDTPEEKIKREKNLSQEKKRK